MVLSKEAILNGIKQMREQGKKRKFEQSVDFSVTIKGLDPKKPESRVSVEVTLPHGVGEPKRILVFGEGELARLARNAGADLVMNRAEVEALKGNKKKIKKLAEGYDFTMAQTDYMVLIGKVFGPVFGPRGMMPKPIPPTANPAPLLERLRKTVRLTARSQLGLHTKIGKESMTNDQLAENAVAVLEGVDRKVTGIGGEIKAVYLKTTMGKPIKLETG
jgi:large subunit ribosomal protein L1